MYSNTDIKLAIERGDITIEPFNDNQLGVNSYDVRLGNMFYEVLWDEDGPYFIGPHHYADGDRVSIPVSGTLLGMTKERIGTSGKVVAELRSRSTTRRIGITTNCDAGLGDIGYGIKRDNAKKIFRKADHWAMEFTAFVSNSLLVGIFSLLNDIFSTIGINTHILYDTENIPFLIVGQPVAQMVFFECKSKPEKQYDGQYRAEWPLNMIPREYRHRIFKVRDSN
jgi:deoxycytidine triphosphate deaminase